METEKPGKERDQDKTRKPRWNAYEQEGQQAYACRMGLHGKNLVRGAPQRSSQDGDETHLMKIIFDGIQHPLAYGGDGIKDPERS